MSSGSHSLLLSVDVGFGGSAGGSGGTGGMFLVAEGVSDSDSGGTGGALLIDEGVSGSSLLLLLRRLQNPVILSLLLSGVTMLLMCFGVSVFTSFSCFRLSFLSFFTLVGDSSHSPSIN